MSFWRALGSAAGSKRSRTARERPESEADSARLTPALGLGPGQPSPNRVPSQGRVRTPDASPVERSFAAEVDAPRRVHLTNATKKPLCRRCPTGSVVLFPWPARQCTCAGVRRVSSSAARRWWCSGTTRLGSNRIRRAGGPTRPQRARRSEANTRFSPEGGSSTFSRPIRCNRLVW